LVANGLADNYVWEFFGGNSSPWASATFDLGSPTNPSGPLGENPDGVAFDPTNGDLYLSGDGEEFSLWDRSNATLTNYLVGSAGQDTGLGYDLAFQTVTTVPEPATWALLGICAAGAVVLVRRRSRRGVATAAVAAATAIALAVGSAAPVEASNIMINGGFELPANPNTTVGQYNESLVPGWETSASDDNIEIWSNGYGGVFAAEGNQHAELNATEVSTLYQDVSGIPANATVGYSFAHRGRLGVDTLRLTISDLGSDNAAGGSGPAADTTLFSQLFSTGNTAWVQYSAPTIGNLTLGNDMRFAFESVSAAGGNQAIGNFLDNVQFGVDVGYVVPEPATAALSLGGLAGLTLAARRRRRAPPGQRCCT
jgi:hypothetical protein